MRALGTEIGAIMGTDQALVDIAGVAATAEPVGWKTKGMTGFGARLLVDALERFGA